MKEKICQFKTVKVNIPKKMLIKLFYCNRPLTIQEGIKLDQKLTQLENKINQLLHVRSVVEKVLLKR